MINEAAAQLAAPRRKTKTRSQAKRAWDRDHPGTTYRLDPATTEAITEIKAWYRSRGYKVTLSQLAEDLLQYGIAAWHQGNLHVEVMPIKSDRPLIAKDSR